MSINVKDVAICGLTDEMVKIGKFPKSARDANEIIGMGIYSPKERGLRNRIRFLKQLYPDLSDRLIDKFLNTRSTITELRKVLYSTRLKLPPRNQYSYIRTRSRNVLKQDALRQEEVMENIIRSRSHQTKRPA